VRDAVAHGEHRRFFSLLSARNVYSRRLIGLPIRLIQITGQSYRLRHQDAAENARLSNSRPANLPTGSDAKKKPEDGSENPVEE